MSQNSPPHLVIDHDNQLPQINCNNYDPLSFNPCDVTNNKNIFSIIGQNIRSCRKNFCVFLNMLNLISIQFSVIVLYET